MKPLLQKVMVVPLLRSLLLGLGMAQVLISPLQADEIVNIDNVKDCRRIGGDTERLSCYDTVINGGVFNEQKLRQVQVEEFGSETMPKAPASAPTPAPAPAPTSAPTPAPAPAPTSAPTPAPAPAPASAPTSAPAPAVATGSAVVTAPEAKPAAVPEQKTPPVAGKVVSENRLDVTIVRFQKGNFGIHFFQTSDGQVWKQQNARSWNLKAPFEAKIKKGAMGSFFLVTEGGKSTRVKRVK